MKILRRPQRSRVKRFLNLSEPSSKTSEVLAEKPKLHANFCKKRSITLKHFRENDDSQSYENKKKPVKPSTYYLLLGLKASTSLEDLELGKFFHGAAAGTGDDSSRFVVSTLINMYVKCGSLVEAQRVFECSSNHSVVSWNALIRGFAENGEGELALELFHRMKQAGFQPDSRAFISALKACICLAEKEQPENQTGVKLASLERAMKLHSEAMKIQCDSDLFLASTLIDLYSSCGSTRDARRVFDNLASPDVVAWTSMIQAFAANGDPDLALEAFWRLISSGCEADARAFTSALKACSVLAEKEEPREIAGGKMMKLSALERAMELHSLAGELERDSFVTSILVDLYSRCGSLLDARLVFDRMERFSVVSLSSLALGYGESGESWLALELLLACAGSELFASLVEDPWSLAAGLKACSSLACFEAGRMIHGEICRLGVEQNEIISTSLLDFYCKCGSMVKSQLVFDCGASRDSIAWNALLSGFSQQGDSGRVFETFHQMLGDGIQPGEASFVSLLSACSHSGLESRALRLFQVMRSSRFGIRASIEHYHCMIDLLCRGNRVIEAVRLLQQMPHEASSVSWRIVLAGACKRRDLELAKLAFEQLMRLDRNDAIAYTLMANLYSTTEEFFDN